MPYAFYFSFFFLSLSSLLFGTEVRAICENASQIREQLAQKEALFQGDYSFTDFIYKQNDFEDEFIRIRLQEKPRENQKKVEVIHKKRNMETNVVNILFRKEFDSFNEARRVVPHSFHGEISFSRVGWEYTLGEKHLFVEEIEGKFSSIEIIAPTGEEILDFFKEFKVTEILDCSLPQYLRGKLE